MIRVKRHLTRKRGCSAGSHQDFALRIIFFYYLSQSLFYLVSDFRRSQRQSVVAVYGALDSAGPCERFFRSQENRAYGQQPLCYFSLAYHFSLLSLLLPAETCAASAPLYLRVVFSRPPQSILLPKILLRIFHKLLQGRLL